MVPARSCPRDRAFERLLDVRRRFALELLGDRLFWLGQNSFYLLDAFVVEVRAHILNVVGILLLAKIKKGKKEHPILEMIFFFYFKIESTDLNDQNYTNNMI